MSNRILLVTYAMDAPARAVVEDALAGAAQVVYLSDVEDGQRAGVLSSADVVLARNTKIELREGEHQRLKEAALLQFVTAGVDFIPLGEFPSQLPIAFNGGGYAEPMAEHGLAMALAGAKRLLTEHQNLARGDFNQFVPNRLLAGRVCGILGFGGIGIACARLFRAIGMSVHAINRRGVGDESVDWMGTPADLDDFLTRCDVLILSLPLTRVSKEMIGERELNLMPDDAILVNLARGEIVQEAALYAHLQRHPAFVACIDAWWVEPVRHGEFRMDHDFMSLPNVIASPHNSATTHDWPLVALGRAVENCKRVLEGGTAYHRVGEDERIA